MKYPRSTVALLAVGALSTAAHAQNSVTLYGIVDAGVLFINNVGGHQQVSMSQGNSSRWGLKGAEDLGGDLKAVFNLESGFTTATGTMAQGGLLFGRTAYVGLSSTRWGTVTAGRQFSTSTDFVGPLSAGASWLASGVALATHTSDIDNLDGANRIQNSVKYVSSNYNGLQFGGIYSFGGVAGNITSKQVVDTAVSYANGPVRLAAGYMFVKDPYYATYGNQGNSSTSSTGTFDNMNNRIYGGYASASSQQIIAMGGSYAIGQTTLGLVYSNTQFGGLGSVVAGGAIAAPSYTGKATFNTGEANVKYQVTPALVVGGSYVYTHNSGADGFPGAHYNQFNVGTVYSLSKQTSLYAYAFYETAAGTDSTGHAAVANLYGSNYSSTNKQVAAIVGIVQRF